MLRFVVQDHWDKVRDKLAWRIWDNVKSEFTFTLYSKYEAAKAVADRKNNVESY